MSTKYRFLRFESVGVTTIIFLILVLLPFYWSKELFSSLELNLESVVAGIGAIFLFSLPLGYISHQLIVNTYRSEKKKRIMHNIIEDLILEIQNAYNIPANETLFFSKFCEKQKMSYLTSYLDLFFFYKSKNIDPKIDDKLSSLWSHFYARKAVGIYSPCISLLLSVLILSLSWVGHIPIKITGNRILISGSIWVSIFLVGLLLINPYSEKIWLEINYLEAHILLSDFELLRKNLKKIVYWGLKNASSLTQF